MPSASGLSGPTTVRSAWLLLREGAQAGQILRAEVDALDRRAVLGQAFLGDAGVARRAPHLRDVRATAPVSKPARARVRRSR